MEEKKFKMSNVIIILAVVVVIIGIIWAVMASQEVAKDDKQVNTNPVVTPVPTASPNMVTTPIETAEPKVETATLLNVKDQDVSGEATRKFMDSIFTHTVTATLPDLAEGKFYEGWLVTKDSADFFSTGKMQKDGGDYKLSYESNQNYADYSQVVITVEEIDDQKPEEHILEGSFNEKLSL